MAEALQKLHPRHYAAIRLRIEGRPNSYICEQIGCKERVLHLWFSDPLVKAELARQMERVQEMFAERLVASAMSGLNAMEELLATPLRDPDVEYEVKLRAVESVLDRNPFTARPAGQQGSPVNVYVGSLTDDQLRAKARELAQSIAGEAEEEE